MSRREIFWAPVRWPGFEHCRVALERDATEAEGLVVGVREGKTFRARYAVSCDDAWRTRRLRVEVEGGAALELHGDGDGHWRSVKGDAVGALDGCLDVDISVTPFTNTLPVRRLGLAPHDPRDLRVVYVDVPALRVGVANQRYTCLLRREDGTIHRYESGTFSADLTCDADGLVIEYPRAFTRIWPR